MYKVSLTTKLKPPQTGLIAIEPEDYTLAEVKALKKSGATVLAYLSVGSISDERPYYRDLKQYQLKRLDDWPHEHYLDLRQPKVREWIQKRAKNLKTAGFDGWWLDNVDVYEEYKSTEMFHAMTSTLQAIKAVGGYVMINGGVAYLTDLLIPHKAQLGAYMEKSNAGKVAAAVKAKGFKASIIRMDNLYKVQAGAFSAQAGADQLVEKLHNTGFYSAKRISLYSGKASSFIDGVTQEEVFSLITDYSGRGKFGNQSQEESERYQTHMRRVRKAGIDAFLLEYTRSNTLRLRIRAFCATHDMGYCISDDVDL
ncbi:MAG: endo alpha-1,4 polygalactosaminidase [Eubacteriales bacterium]|nr:endo alpha-1,4 polygalactosaminidase [Eubacteriales bacterium]